MKLLFESIYIYKLINSIMFDSQNRNCLLRIYFILQWIFLIIFFILIFQIYDYYKSNNHHLRIITYFLLLHFWIYSFHNSIIYEYMKKNNQFYQLIKINENLGIWSEELISSYRYINLVILIINNALNWAFEYKTIILQILKYISSIISNMILKVYISIFHQNIW